MHKFKIDGTARTERHSGDEAMILLFEECVVACRVLDHRPVLNSDCEIYIEFRLRRIRDGLTPVCYRLPAFPYDEHPVLDIFF